MSYLKKQPSLNLFAYSLMIYIRKKSCQLNQQKRKIIGFGVKGLLVFIILRLSKLNILLGNDT